MIFAKILLIQVWRGWNHQNWFKTTNIIKTAKIVETAESQTKIKTRKLSK